jgi:hypothetical protein
MQDLSAEDSPTSVDFVGGGLYEGYSSESRLILEIDVPHMLLFPFGLRGAAKTSANTSANQAHMIQ